MSSSSTLPVYSLLPLQIESVVRQLLQESMADPWGHISFGIYDTTCALLLPPALQPKGNLEFVLHNQNGDGSCGDPSVYCIGEHSIFAKILYGLEAWGYASKAYLCRLLAYVGRLSSCNRTLPRCELRN
ncbi:hypothetical protein F7734_28405 [Scytonema sp. UIC 10036]|uniref:hypothetical protein n=1 Tax=Scytonema sp. UIC 10036 TaxID=2304196 RepID=UPI0012DA067D|nr:hypothetical protein [Scytonema sp. UIC 10036]MUG96057.1 hypothetical protein [Scytonema sp. UIC 10036]